MEVPGENRKKSGVFYYCKYYAPVVAAFTITVLLYAVYLRYYGQQDRLNYVIAFAVSPSDSQNVPRLYSPRGKPGLKVILFWNKFFGWDIPYLHDKMEACPNRTCFLTDDRRYLSQSSAVVFHGRNLNANDLPSVRKPTQLYVFFLLESPVYTGVRLDAAPWKNFFNLSWTYRQDSDIFCPFYLSDWNVELWTDRNKTRKYLEKKKDGAVMFSSNCDTHSRREDYVHELMKYFPVRVIGGCGTTDCPKEDGECEKNLTEQFKFYLAFENSDCKDYVTEKAIRPYNFGTVPVFLGGANYSELFPKHSFVELDDFASPKDLGDHLWFLAHNFDLYESYYDWRFDSSLTHLPALRNLSNVDVCKLCDIVRDGTFRRVSFDLHQWWDTDASCKLPRGV